MKLQETRSFLVIMEARCNCQLLPEQRCLLCRRFVWTWSSAVTSS
jgi:hypothetical protein